MTNNTTERVYIKLILKTKSPFSVCSGMDEFSDKDIIKRGGEPFIPGSTLAGIFRNYIETNNISISGKDKDDIIKEFFGYIKRGNTKEEHKARQSTIYFGDAVLVENENNCSESSTSNAENQKKKSEPKFIISFRDGVKLDDRKTAINTGKYNYEIIEQGAKFETIIEYCGDSVDAEVFKGIIKQVATAINSGELRIGSKTSRGLGYMGAQYYSKTFTKEKVEEWLDFDPYSEDKWEEEELATDINFYGIEADIKIPDTLMIRDYNVDPNMIFDSSSEQDVNSDSTCNSSIMSENNCDKDAVKSYPNIEKLDYGQLCSSNKYPVIPGTTWAGAFRHRSELILEEILYSMSPNDIGVDVISDKDKVERVIKEKVNRILNIAFGPSENLQKVNASNDEKNDEKFCKSNLSFFESEIENGTIIPITRTKIDRFTGGSMHGSLFTENVCCGGKTTLKIGINRNCDKKKAVLGLIFLCLDDLGEGLLAIGGETAVGRGIMEVKIKDNNDFIREECIKSLAEELRKK